ncbi:Adrenodoxin like protein [Astathelohania contejeani]|uniref:2Fe-2S ferredoxin n=1 Tax=Astathelohania contejeani TaxID=164912 RepID=A0ABQ7I079_9MICR|nr:Adrenodoxin like protein [Thelohania contejeani]
MALPNPTVNFFFKTKDKIYPIKDEINHTLLEAAHKNNIPLEGACEGSLACSTCHVILSPKLYNKMDEPSDREYDLLDQAFGLTNTSRLGCQVKLGKIFENEIIKIPAATRNIAVDGYIPKPH